MDDFFAKITLLRHFANMIDFDSFLLAFDSTKTIILHNFVNILQDNLIAKIYFHFSYFINSTFLINERSKSNIETRYFKLSINLLICEPTSIHKKGVQNNRNG
jgi:hypothetical protein